MPTVFQPLLLIYHILFIAGRYLPQECHKVLPFLCTLSGGIFQVSAQLRSPAHLFFQVMTTTIFVLLQATLSCQKSIAFLAFYELTVTVKVTIKLETCQVWVQILKIIKVVLYKNSINIVKKSRGADQAPDQVQKKLR